MHTPGNFILHEGDVAFANRQKLLFDKLSLAEIECNKNKRNVSPTEDMDIEQPSRSQQPCRVGLKRKYETKRFSGKESIFKRPEGPAPRANIRSIPDHHRNPHKWVKYSLDCVPNTDMTDQSNTQAALSFLKELRARRIKERANEAHEKMDMDDAEQNDGKIIFKSKKNKSNTKFEFKKPENEEDRTQTAKVIVDHDDKPMFRSSKLVMPEYVVGQKQQKKKNKDKPLVKVDRSKELKLDHLQELDEEEED